ncbi:MAG: D-2-hydroxyacid dehydrogenase [SAR324 cluster bacterium]|nr:D-2-hydroxyacid dehydrogenase [SAR324 cluster bacterium]
MKVYSYQKLDEQQQERLQRIQGVQQACFYQGNGNETDPPVDFIESSICFGNPPADWLPHANQMKWIQLISVGFGEYLPYAQLIQQKDLTITNLKGFFRVPVAESILGGIFSLYRQLNQLRQLQTERKWAGDDLRESLRTLMGRKVVLIGRGAIHQQLIAYLAPFKCEISVFGSDYNSVQLDQALNQADILVCAVPATPKTNHILHSERLALLPKNAIFLNFGRSNIVDTPALIQMLETEQLAGAVLDVTDDEPLGPKDPLWTTPNLLLTQHTSGGMPQETDRKLDFFDNNLQRHRKGEELINEIDLSKGY